MSGLFYNGRDFSPYVAAELVEPAGHALEPRTVRVPGRPGAVLLGCELPPRVLRVRLHLDAGATLAADERSAVRHTLYSWLVAPAGAELSLPGEPRLTWRGAVVTGVSEWDELFEGGSCTVEFTCFDPVAYGEEASSTEELLEVGGTWETWPTVTLTARAGVSVMVGDDQGRYVIVERTFAAGDVVAMDFAAETVTVQGRDASADVTLDSTFFPLSPGTRQLSFIRCSAHTVAWTERWL